MRKRIYTHLLCVLPLAIMGTALFLRFYPMQGELSSHLFLRHDELHYLPRIISYLNGDWEVRYFVNPAFYMYMFYGAAAVTGWLLVLVGYFSSFEAFVLYVTLDPLLLLVIGRVLTMAAAAASVGLLFLLAKRMFSLRVAVLASLALAFNLIHAARSVLAGNECFMVFMVLLFFLCLDRYSRAPGPGRHALCGFVLGLAVAVKYNAFIHVIPLAAVSLLCAFEDGAGKEMPLPRRLMGMVGRAAFRLKYSLGYPFILLGFLAGTPFVLLNFNCFIEEFGFQYSLLHEGWTLGERAAEIPGFLAYATQFPGSNNGFAFAVLCGLGLAASIFFAVKGRDRRHIILLAAILPLYCFLGTGIFHRMRFFLPAIPFVLLCGAWAFDRIMIIISAFLFSRKRALLARGSLLEHGCFLVLAAGVLGPSAFRTHQEMEKLYGGVHPMEEMVVWIDKHVLPGEKILEFAFPSQNEYPRSTRMLTSFGYREEWFRTEKGRESFRQFKESLLSITPLRSALAQSSSLKECRARIEADGYRYILFTLPSQYQVNLTRDGNPTETICPYWRNFMYFVSSLKQVKAITSPDNRLILRLYELP